MSRTRVVIFARYPEPGRAKTRTIPALGDQGAAELQSANIDHTLKQVLQFAQSECEIEIRFTGATTEAMRERFGSATTYVDQGSGDLGERLERTVHDAFDQQVEHLLIIGTDCPDLTAQHLALADQALRHADLVLGPAVDGGYYLVGMRSKQLSIFRQIDWSTERVLDQTRRAASQDQLKVHELERLSDIDEPEDLLICRRFPDSFRELFPAADTIQVSVIIPVLNEEQTLSRSLEPLLGLSQIEVIVVDGGSADQTVSVARGLGVRVIQCRAGRARQMNAGAAIAKGQTLLFLHADTRLPSGFQRSIVEAMQQESKSSRVVGGAFRLQIDDRRSIYRWLERGVTLRSRWWGRPYGDQALFVRADVFYALGGFRLLPLMEDYEFVGRLRQHGSMTLLTAAVITSARRWQRLGPLKTTLINQWIVIAYHCGVSPERLAAWYRGRKGR